MIDFIDYTRLLFAYEAISANQKIDIIDAIEALEMHKAALEKKLEDDFWKNEKTP